MVESTPGNWEKKPMVVGLSGLKGKGRNLCSIQIKVLSPERRERRGKRLKGGNLQKGIKGASILGILFTQGVRTFLRKNQTDSIKYR